MHVTCMGKFSCLVHPLIGTSHPALDTHMSLRSMERSNISPVLSQLFTYTWEPTMGEEPTSVKYIPNPLVFQVHVECVSRFTVENSPVSIIKMTQPLLVPAHFAFVEGLTPKKTPLNLNHVPPLRVLPTTCRLPAELLMEKTILVVCHLAKLPVAKIPCKDMK